MTVISNAFKDTVQFKIWKYLIFGRIVKVLFHLIDAIGKLYKMIGLNR